MKYRFVGPCGCLVIVTVMVLASCSNSGVAGDISGNSNPQFEGGCTSIMV